MKVFKFTPNDIYQPVFTEKYDICDIWGGRGRGGSHFVTDLFLFKITQPYYFRGYFMRFIHSDIRGSLYQDFKDRLEEHPEIDINDFSFDDTKMLIKYLPTGNMILSKGFRKSQGSATAKLKSIAGATDVCIEESEEISLDDFNKLLDSLRTKKAELHIYRIFNPPSKNHWIIKDYYDILPLTKNDLKDISPDVWDELCRIGKTDKISELLDGYFIARPKKIDGFISIFSTYKENEQNVNLSTIKRFEGYKFNNLEHYLTDIRGFISGGAKGLIYKHFEDVDYKPDLEFYTLYCIDFGHTDPCSINRLDVNLSTKSVYVTELLYKTHASNDDIIFTLKNDNVNFDEVVCDSARPDKITELQAAGFNAFGAKKGQGSIIDGIDIVKKYNIFLISAENTRNEVNLYKWARDREKNPTGKPEDKNNHSLDALRYGLTFYHLEYGIYN